MSTSANLDLKWQNRSTQFRRDNWLSLTDTLTTSKQTERQTMKNVLAREN